MEEMPETGRGNNILESTGCAPRLLRCLWFCCSLCEIQGIPGSSPCWSCPDPELRISERGFWGGPQGCLLILRELFLLFQLILAMEELRQCRLQQRNISATVDKLTLCLPGEEPPRFLSPLVEFPIFCFRFGAVWIPSCVLLSQSCVFLLFPVLEMYSKLREQMKSKR